MTTEIQIPDLTLDVSQMTNEELRSAILRLPRPELVPLNDSVSSDEPPPPLIELTGLNRQAALCMRLPHRVRIHGKGHLGDFAFAWCEAAEVHLEGSVGDGACEGMTGGRVRITGNAKCGLGAAMTGGTLAVYGSAGPRVGAAMRGGSIFVRGDVGEDAGAGALGGTIVVGGDAGMNLGDGLNNVTVFLRGKAESLAPGVIQAPLRKREEVRLGLLLMNASIRGKPSDFRRIIPAARWQAEEAGAGEVRPNWR